MSSMTYKDKNAKLTITF